MELWIGLISGTSADGVDAALIRIGAGPGELELLAYRSDPLPAGLSERIRTFAAEPVELRELLQVDREIGERFAASARSLLSQAEIAPERVSGIGSHGQTVAHYPEPEVQGSLQLGSAAVIEAATGLPVVSDFRSADLAAGGQGAPLTPFVHRRLFAAPDEARAVLNIGGFTNVTFMGAGGSDLGAFDPGPGNALIDRAVRFQSEGREAFDRDGARARAGRVRERVLKELLDDPYFDRAPPRSTGHEYFGAEFFAHARKRILEESDDPNDLIATLARLTVESIVACARFAPEPPARWLLCGGGVHNPMLVEPLRERLAPARVETTDDHGIPADALEAVGFALLGWAARNGIDSNVPEATGARRGVVLGTLTPPSGSGGR